MQVSISLVLEMLRDYGVQPYLQPERSFAFDHVAFLSDSLPSLSPSVLYLGRLSQVRALKDPSLPDVCIVCAGKPASLEKFLPSYIGNLLALPEDSDLFTVANHLLEGFRKLNDWENDLNTALLSGMGLETMADIAGRVFDGNPLLICSSSYNILGCSRKEAPENEKVDAVLKRGYFVKEESDALSSMGYQAHREKYRSGVMVNLPTYMGCPFFLITFPAHLKPAAFIAVYFVASSPSEGQLDLFRIFAHYVRKYCESMQKGTVSNPSLLELFMDDLLMHTHEEELYLTDRARQLNLPTDETYRLGLVQWDEYSRDQAEYVLWRLRSVFVMPAFLVMRYHEAILLILRGDASLSFLFENIRDTADAALDFLSIGGGRFGFSTEVSSLMKLDVAYKQACSAIRYGRMLAPDEMMYFYSRMYIYDMADAYREKFELEDMYVQKLSLLNNAEEGRYNNLHLLRYYLLSERSISSTAQLLHLHRNSVIYRLGKIEKTLGVDLDDPDVRLRLLISLKILELLDGHLMPDLTASNPPDIPAGME